MLGAKLAQYSMATVDLAIRSIPVPFAYSTSAFHFLVLNVLLSLLFLSHFKFAFDRLVGIQL